VTDAEIAKARHKHNMDVYEHRVARAYINEFLARSMYNQKVQASSDRRREHFREVVASNRADQDTILTPRTRRLRAEAHTQAVLSRMLANDTPVFRDVTEGLSPRLDQMALDYRHVPGHK
jgi:hypothetical protein